MKRWNGSHNNNSNSNNNNKKREREKFQKYRKEGEEKITKKMEWKFERKRDV